MWLCVIITFSIVSFFWFKSTAREFVAVVNPQKAQAERVLAEKEKANQTNQPSVLATISDSLANLRSSFSGLVGVGDDQDNEFSNRHNNPAPPTLFPTPKPNH